VISIFLRSTTLTFESPLSTTNNLSLLTKSKSTGFTNPLIIPLCSNVFAKTFEHKGMISGFVKPVDFDFVSNDRLFVVDKGDSKVKVVDLKNMEITSDIETGGLQFQYLK
jgi:hypothetical protein